MSDGWRAVATNPQFNALASAIIGALLIGLSQIMGDASPLVVPEIAMLIGGILLLGVGILGTWSPERWGVQPQNPWLGVLNGMAIVLLLAATVIQIV